MNDAAIISAQLVDIRNVGQHKSVKLTLHVPAEEAQTVMAAFGWPTMVEPVPVAIARLDLQAVKNEATREASREAESDRCDSDASASRIQALKKEVVPADPKLRPPDTTPALDSERPVRAHLAQKAALLCKDELFWRYLEEVRGFAKGVTEVEATKYVRSFCGVNSRSEILLGTVAATELAKLHNDFRLWLDADKFVEAVG